MGAQASLRAAANIPMPFREPGAPLAPIPTPTPTPTPAASPAPVSEASGATAAPGHGHTLERGQTLGRFVVLGMVGRGAMGEVYAAYDPELERKVAVKLLRPRSSRTNEGHARLVREAQAIAKLSHPNVVVVYDVGTHEDGVFVAMEFIEGSTVGVWLLAGQRSWRDVLKVFMAAGRGLAAAHEADLVHRDFKPENVMLGADGQVRVMDFGLARRVLRASAAPVSSHEEAAMAALEASGSTVADQDLVSTRKLAPVMVGGARATATTTTTAVDATATGTEGANANGSTWSGSKITQTGARVGTPAYMAPEQFAGALSDARTDQFSFCVALYEALYGERPFAGNDMTSLMTAVMTGDVRPAPASSRVPAWVRRILLRGISNDPRARFPNMGALLDALGSDPAARRRKWVGAVAGVLAMSAVAVAAQGIGSGQRTLCAGAAAHLGGVWEPGGVEDTPRKASILRAFKATGRSFAERAFAGTSRLLDQYADRWTAMHTEACQATHVRGEQSAEVLDLRMACLRERATNLRALTDTLARADAAVVENAVSAAGALPALDRCADVAMLRAVVKPPDDPERRRQVAAQRDELAHLIALRDSGQCVAAVAAGARLLVEVRKTDYLPLVAETANAVAYLGDSCGDVHSSIDLYKQAYAAAVRSHHDLAAAEAAAILPTLAQDRLHDTATARDWVLIGRAMSDRLGNNPVIDAWVTVSEGVVLAGEGHHEAALASQRHALDLKVRALGLDHPDTLSSKANVALALQNAGRLEEALAYNRETLAVVERVLGPDHPRAALVSNNMGEVLNLLGRHDEAAAVFERSVECWRRAGSDAALMAYGLVGLGLARLEGGHPRQAVAPLEEALRVRLDRHADAQLLGEARFALARALRQRPGDESRARAMAEQARTDYLAARDAEHAAAVDVWLGKRS